MKKIGGTEMKKIGRSGRSRPSPVRYARPLAAAAVVLIGFAGCRRPAEVKVTETMPDITGVRGTIDGMAVSVRRKAPLYERSVVVIEDPARGVVELPPDTNLTITVLKVFEKSGRAFALVDRIDGREGDPRQSSGQRILMHSVALAEVCCPTKGQEMKMASLRDVIADSNVVSTIRSILDLSPDGRLLLLERSRPTQVDPWTTEWSGYRDVLDLSSREFLRLEALPP